MKATRLLAMCMALVWGLSAVPLARADDATVQEITALEQAFNAAYAANDLPTYFSHYADDAILWDPSGRSTLAGYRKSWTAFIEAGNALQSAQLLDMKVQVGPGGDTAVATYRAAMETRAADGKLSKDEYQETDVWFRRDGQWKIVTLHYSPAAM